MISPDVEVLGIFQSTLPHGSDIVFLVSKKRCADFNPRSLTGATIDMFRTGKYDRISIHAPSRERPCTLCYY